MIKASGHGLRSLDAQAATVPAPQGVQGQPVSGAQVVQAAAAAGAHGAAGQAPGAQQYQ